VLPETKCRELTKPCHLDDRLRVKAKIFAGVLRMHEEFQILF
jgi:hypothetical protein